MIQSRLESLDLRSAAVGERHSPELHLTFILTRTIGSTNSTSNRFSSPIIDPGLVGCKLKISNEASAELLALATSSLFVTKMR